MSFSFTARGATVALALAAVAAEMAKVVETQPVHKHDAEAVQKTAEHYAGLLPETEGHDVVIACHGYVEYHGTDAAPEFVGANVGINARLLKRESQPEAGE